MANEKLIEALSKRAMQSYTPRELELISLGVRIGAQNAKDINKRPEEWYAEREAKKPTQEEVDATTEWLKRESGLGAALERLKKMKSYEEVETEVLERLFRALANNPVKAQEMIDMLRLSIKQYYVLHPQEKGEIELTREQAIARRLYAESLRIRDAVGLKVATRAVLNVCGIHTLQDLVAHTKESLLKQRGVGRSTMLDIEEWLSGNNFGGLKFELGKP